MELPENNHQVNTYLIDGLINRLKSEEMQSIWNHNYVSKQDQNPANHLIATLEKIEGKDLDQHPQVIKFMHRYFELTDARISIKDTNKSPELHDIKQEMQLAKNYTEKLYATATAKLRDDYDHHFNLAPSTNSIDVKLPPEQEEYLGFYERRLALDSANPLVYCKRFIAGGMHHAIEHMKEQPVLCAAFTPVAVMGILEVNNRMGSTVNFDPTRLATNISAGDIKIEDTSTADYLDNLSLDSLDEYANSEGAETISRDDLNNIDINDQFGCHDSIAELAKTDTSNLGISLNGCFRNDTNVYESQDLLVSAYEFIYKDRYDFGLYESTMSLGDTILPHGDFFNAFTQGAEAANTLWTQYDFVENIILHPPMFLAAAVSSLALTSLNKEEWSELKNSVKDTAQRIRKNSPLAPTLALTSAAAVTTLNGGLDPSVVWAGIGGAFAGEYTHRYLRATRSGLFITDTAQKVKDSVATLIPSSSAQDGFQFAPEVSTWKAICNSTKNRFIAATTASLIAADAYATGGQTMATIAGGGIVTGKFWMGNAVQEMAWHASCLGAGALTGSTLGGVFRSVKGLARKITGLFNSTAHSNAEPLSAAENDNTPENTGSISESIEQSNIIFSSRSDSPLSQHIQKAAQRDAKTPCPYQKLSETTSEKTDKSFNNDEEFMFHAYSK